MKDRPGWGELDLPEQDAGGPLKAQLAVIFVSRTVLNTAHRIIYPFLPSIARGLGISLAAASALVTVRLVAGLAAPIIGPLADRAPRRRAMEVALLLFGLAGLLLVGVDILPAAVLAFALYGLTKAIYDPSVHAYLGDTVPYAQRGRAVGVVELSWSSAWLLGVPVAGFLGERYGWQAPWALLAGLGFLSLALTHLGLPLSRHPVQQAAGLSVFALLLRQWRELLAQRRIVALLLISLLLTAAQEIPFIVYGAWLETSFGLSLTTLGLASITVGLAEATAEVGTTVLTDRLGKRRSVLAGLLGMIAGLLLLPGLARLGLVGALAGLVLVMLTFEFAIVSLIPLATELAPRARASLLSLNLTAFSLGRMLGAVAGGLLWQAQAEGIALHAITGAACALAAALLTFRGLADAQESGPTNHSSVLKPGP